jgi:hypothetical protein
MSEFHHLLVVAGVGEGRRYTVTPAGARLGRSSKNDIVVEDALLSRHHCRFYFRPGQGLWVTDLASANGTSVNDQPIQDSVLHVGDVVTVGETRLQVLSDQMLAATAAVSAPVAQAEEPVVDLGLRQGPVAPARPQFKLRRSHLAVAVCLVTALAIAAWAPKFFKRPKPNADRPVIPSEAPKRDLTLHLEYEKIVAGKDNIFRYHLLISPNLVAAAQVDDIGNGKHLRKEKRVEQKVLEGLAEDLLDAKVFGLAPEYQGVQPDSLESRDMSVTIGRRTHRSKVVNRLLPEAFQQISDMVEKFGVNHLGLFTIPESPEELRRMANEAYMLGRKLFEERDVKFSNLSEAIKRLTEAELFLETIEPKPDYYRELIGLRNDCKTELKTRFDDHQFSSQKAIRLRDWQEAARELRILMTLVPDTEDERYQNARKDLLDVERHIRKKD